MPGSPVKGTSMQTYTIKTDADEMTTTASSFNDAARQYDRTVATAQQLIDNISATDGGWCWIECEETGERMERVASAQ